MVPARVPRSPPEVLVTTPAVDRPTSVTEVLAVTVVKVAAPAEPEPMVPGEAKVAPFKDEAFKLATLVVEAMTNGAVPVDTVDVIWPEAVTVVVPTPVAPVIAPLLSMTMEAVLRKLV